MKPRLEKKLSKALVAIFAGTKQLAGAWIDNEYYRETHSTWSDTLTPKQVRENRETRVSVNHMPCVGGELDYWGEGTDWYTVHCAFKRNVCDGIWYEDELFRLSHRWDDQPPRTAEEEARLGVLQARAQRESRRLRKGLHLLAHAREQAAVLRMKEAIQARNLAASKARWAAEAAARKETQQIQPETEGTPA
jgi:hypothetical protein